MTEEKLQQPLLECRCADRIHEIRLPMVIPTGRPVPWPKGDPAPVQNFCCLQCREARPYSIDEVHRHDIAPREQQSPYGLIVVRQVTECGEKDCDGTVEILAVVRREALKPPTTRVLQFPLPVHFEGLYCTGKNKHKNSTDATTAGTVHVLGLWKLPVVDENWEKIQSLCAGKEW
jgi:hypothetical protein